MSLLHAISTQFFVIYSLDFDVDINPIENGPRNTLLILGNDSRRTRTGFLCLQKITAWAGVYTNELFL